MSDTAFDLPRPQPSWRRVLAVWRRFQRVYFKFFLANVLPPFLEPLMFILALGVGLASYVGAVNGLSYAVYLAPGMIGATAMWGASFETTYGTFFRMEYEKIYDAILGSPVSFREMLAGEVLWVSSKCALFSLGVLIVVGSFGLVGSWWSLMVVPLGFIGGMLFALMGILVTSRVQEINNFNFYLTGLITPMFYFSGAIFPLEHFPDWLRTLCLMMPFTHLVRLLQAFVWGDFSFSLLLNLAVVLGFLVVLWPLAATLLRRRIVV